MYSRGSRSPLHGGVRIIHVIPQKRGGGVRRKSQPNGFMDELSPFGPEAVLDGLSDRSQARFECATDRAFHKARGGKRQEQTPEVVVILGQGNEPAAMIKL